MRIYNTQNLTDFLTVLNSSCYEEKGGLNVGKSISPVKIQV
uniref:Uncharacterized protein n=1 Tax=Siphoviridae sp. ctnMb19 TaxID=2825659 RepID=A0A8S5NTF2_9CAUD|nr:MAG TPA: hypothetical protein [Siphoviridae sp. ctnMb19]